MVTEANAKTGKRANEPFHAYLRVSGKAQLTGHGPQRQEELIREFAARAGYALVADMRTPTPARRRTGHNSRRCRRR
jgi:hypothetical protein